MKEKQQQSTVIFHKGGICVLSLINNNNELLSGFDLLHTD